MINKDKIVLNEPVYYMPIYSGAVKIKILELKNDNVALVQMVFKKSKKKFKPFTIPIQHIYNKPGHAYLGRREWENYMRKNKKHKKKN